MVPKFNPLDKLFDSNIIVTRNIIEFKICIFMSCLKHCMDEKGKDSAHLRNMPLFCEVRLLAKMVAGTTLKLIHLYLEYLLNVGRSKLEILISNEKLYNFLVKVI